MIKASIIHSIITPYNTVFIKIKHTILHFQKIKPDSIVYTDCYGSYNALDVSEFKHYRINHSEIFANKHNHINGIENFWNQAKRVLRKYNGIPKNHFPLFLKECEFRFNYGSPKEQLKTLKQWMKRELKIEKNDGKKHCFLKAKWKCNIVCFIFIKTVL